MNKRFRTGWLMKAFFLGFSASHGNRRADAKNKGTPRPLRTPGSV